MRAVLLDGHNQLLLQRYHDPSVHRPGGVPHAAPCWIAPGGGIEAGEAPAAALARELYEETGLREVCWGPWLWRRRVLLNYQGALRAFEEHYRFARLAAVAPSVHPQQLAAHEQRALQGHRWWSLAALQETAERVYPLGLATLLLPVLAGVYPVPPSDISEDPSPHR